MTSDRINNTHTHTHTHTHLQRILHMTAIGCAAFCSCSKDALARQCPNTLCLPNEYRIIDLHTIDPETIEHSLALGINDIGEIVGELRHGLFDWDNDGSFVWLFLENYGLAKKTMIDLRNAGITGAPQDMAVARDINIDGRIIGNERTWSTPWGDVVMWDLAGQSMFDLTATVLNDQGQGWALNDLDPPTIVGWHWISGNEKAFRYFHDSPFGVLENLDQLPFVPNTQDPLLASKARGVSLTDWVVGLSTNATAFCNVCYYGVNCSFASWWDDQSTSAGMLTGFDAADTGIVGADINDLHDAVGWSGDQDLLDCGPRATFWPSGDYANPDPLSVPGVDPDDELARANAISNPIEWSGDELHIVGESVAPNLALLWRGSVGNWDARDLNELSCSTDLDFFVLLEGTDINNCGWVVGRMDVDDSINVVSHAFLAIPRDWCPGDLNLDGVVDTADLLILFDAWGTCPADSCCIADLNGDCCVNTADMMIMYDNWGTCPCFDHLDEPEPFESLLAERDLTAAQWAEFVDVVRHGTENDRENYSCWMRRHLSACESCPTCPGADPFEN
jgi:hypothetical protein